jgi:hypothetical protein
MSSQLHRALKTTNHPANEMDHPYNEFELTHYKVFRVNMPLYHEGPARHHIYVETNDSLPSF